MPIFLFPSTIVVFVGLQPTPVDGDDEDFGDNFDADDIGCSGNDSDTLRDFRFPLATASALVVTALGSHCRRVCGDVVSSVMNAFDFVRVSVQLFTSPP